MIGYLNGIVKHDPGGVTRQIIVAAGNTGYVVTTSATIVDPDSCELYIHHAVTNSGASHLYGVETTDELDLLKRLCAVNRFGPASAIAVLGTLGYSSTLGALANNDTDRLVTTPGVGKATAERLVRDVKLDGLDIPETETDAQISRLVNALVSLGVAPQAAFDIFTDVLSSNTEVSDEDAVAEALTVWAQRNAA